MFNINILFNGRNYAIKFVNDCGSMILEVEKMILEERQPKEKDSKL